MGYFNIYGQYVRCDDELYHHGIMGMKWGHKNGPPYPLGSGDHSASEEKAGWRKSLDGNSDASNKRSKVDAEKDKIYKRAKRKGLFRSDKEERGLSKKDIERLKKNYIFKMEPSELNELVELIDDHNAKEAKANAAYDKYLAYFTTDPKRKRIVDNWSGDGTELYMRMQDIMPNKKLEDLTNQEWESFKKAEDYAWKVGKRIANDDYNKYDSFKEGTKRSGYRSNITPYNIANRAVYETADKIAKPKQLRREYDEKEKAYSDFEDKEVAKYKPKNYEESEIARGKVRRDENNRDKLDSLHRDIVDSYDTYEKAAKEAYKTRMSLRAEKKNGVTNTKDMTTEEIIRNNYKRLNENRDDYLARSEIQDLSKVSDKKAHKKWSRYNEEQAKYESLAIDAEEAKDRKQAERVKQQTISQGHKVSSARKEAVAYDYLRVKAMKRSGMTNAEIAEKIGISDSYVSLLLQNV